MILPRNLFDIHEVALWSMVASTGALAIALGSQYFGGLQPCELCIWQRIPYGVVIVSGLAALLWFTSPRERRLLAWLAALCFAAGAVIAVYHTLLEYGLAPGGLVACAGSGSLNQATTIEELRELLEAAPVVRCDQPSWTFSGISMAGWNALASVGLTLYCVTSILKRKTVQ